MSLMKLLTVGQSLRGLTNAPSPYKISAQHCLPKFAPVGRPVSLAPQAARVPAPAPVRSTVRVTRAVPAAPAKAFAQPAVAAVDRHLGTGSGERGGWRTWFSFLLPAPPRPRRPWVQGEMTLDSLKVVRNDLSEADLEVVAEKAAPVAVPAVAAVEPTAVGSAWSRVAAGWSTLRRVGH